MKTLLLVDTANIHYLLANQQRKLNYKNYLAQLAAWNFDVRHLIAYGNQNPDDPQVSKYIAMLEGLHFEIKFSKETKWIHQIYVDAINAKDHKYDCVVFGMNHTNLIPLFSYLRTAGVKCVVYCPSNATLKKAASDVLVFSDALTMQ